MKRKGVAICECCKRKGLYNDTIVVAESTSREHVVCNYCKVLWFGSKTKIKN